jgi:two-component system, chemotaxis family, response regulator Rcp1
MPDQNKASPVEILHIEDNAGDILFTREALKKTTISYGPHSVENGIERMACLLKEGKYAQAPRPDLILLDLNLPGKDGREILAEVKKDKHLCSIPIVIFTSSDTQNDILRSHQAHANGYLTKPGSFDQYQKVLLAVPDYWFMVVKLPPDTGNNSPASTSPRPVPRTVTKTKPPRPSRDPGNTGNSTSVPAANLPAHADR